MENCKTAQLQFAVSKGESSFKVNVPYMVLFIVNNVVVPLHAHFGAKCQYCSNKCFNFTGTIMIYE